MHKNNGNGFQERWRFYELGEAADVLNLSITSLFQYILQNKIKMIFNEGRWKIRDREVIRFHDQRLKNLANRGRPRKEIQNGQRAS